MDDKKYPLYLLTPPFFKNYQNQIKKCNRM